MFNNRHCIIDRGMSGLCVCKHFLGSFSQPISSIPLVKCPASESGKTQFCLFIAFSLICIAMHPTCLTLFAIHLKIPLHSISRKDFKAKILAPLYLVFCGSVIISPGWELLKSKILQLHSKPPALSGWLIYLWEYMHCIFIWQILAPAISVWRAIYFEERGAADHGSYSSVQEAASAGDNSPRRFRWPAHRQSCGKAGRKPRHPKSSLLSRKKGDQSNKHV